MSAAPIVRLLVVTGTILVCAGVFLAVFTDFGKQPVNTYATCRSWSGEIREIEGTRLERDFTTIVAYDASGRVIRSLYIGGDDVCSYYLQKPEQ